MLPPFSYCPLVLTDNPDPMLGVKNARGITHLPLSRSGGGSNAFCVLKALKVKWRGNANASFVRARGTARVTRGGHSIPRLSGY